MSQPPYSGPPYPGQPNPDVPSSVPPQPGFPPAGYPGDQPAYPPTQPFYGPPEYAQPQYGQPQYGQPQYGQPQYGQPQYGQHPGYPPVEPPKSRKLPIILLSVAIVLVLCVGGTTAAVLFANSDDKSEQKAAPTPTATSTPADPSPSSEPIIEPSEPSEPITTVRISAPATLGGRPKLRDAQAAAAAKQLQDSLAKLPGATRTIGAIYGSSTRSNMVVVAAAEAPIDDPAAYVEMIFYGLGSSAVKVTGATEVETGALGGAAKCGTSSDGGLKMAVCSWADEGSMGMIIWYFQTVNKVKSEFPKLRAQIEKKS